MFRATTSKDIKQKMADVKRAIKVNQESRKKYKSDSVHYRNRTNLIRKYIAKHSKLEKKYHELLAKEAEKTNQEEIMESIEDGYARLKAILDGRLEETVKEKTVEEVIENAKQDFRERVKKLVTEGVTHHNVMDLLNSAMDAVLLGSDDENKVYRSDLRKIIIEEVEGYTWVEIRGECRGCNSQNTDQCVDCNTRTYRRYTCFDHKNCVNYGDGCEGCKHSKQGKCDYFDSVENYTTCEDYEETLRQLEAEYVSKFNRDPKREFQKVRKEGKEYISWINDCIFGVGL